MRGMATRKQIAKWMHDVMRATGWSALKWGQEAHTAPSNISRFLRDPDRASLPKQDTLLKLAKAAKVPPPMATPSGMAEEVEPFDQGSFELTFPLVAVKEYDIDAAAGPGNLAEEEAVRTTWGLPGEVVKYEFQASNPSSLAILTVEGDSMEPHLYSGDRVVVDTDRKAPSPPGIFVLWDGLARVIKFVEFAMNSDPPKIRIMSSKERYQTYERTLEEAHIRGRVVGLIRRI